MNLDKHRAAVESAFPSIKEEMFADFEVVEAITKLIKQKNAVNPLSLTEVRDLASQAIATWDDPSMGCDVDDYLRQLLDIYPPLATSLEQQGYGLDIEALAKKTDKLRT